MLDFRKVSIFLLVSILYSLSIKPILSLFPGLKLFLFKIKMPLLRKKIKNPKKNKLIVYQNPPKVGYQARGHLSKICSGTRGWRTLLHHSN